MSFCIVGGYFCIKIAITHAIRFAIFCGVRCFILIWCGIVVMWCHYNAVIMGAIASQIISLTILNSTVYSGADQRKHQSSTPLAFVWGIHRWPVNSPPKWPVTRKMFPFDDVIMSRRKTNSKILNLCDQYRTFGRLLAIEYRFVPSLYS